MHVTPTLVDPIDQQIGFCPSPASKAAASLPVPAAAQGAGTCDVLRDEFSAPAGFWLVCCDCSKSLIPSAQHREERRA